jgi:hypothetical protein
MAQYLPTIGVSIDFSSGAGYGIALQLDDAVNGIIGINVIADTVAQVVDISSAVRTVSIKRGRNLLQDQFETGQATVRLYDPNSYFSPTNSASPYYPNLSPLKKVRIWANYLGVKYYLFSGYVSEYRTTFPIGQETGYVEIVVQDAFRLFNQTNVTTIAGQIAGDTTGNRINDILNTIGWPTSLRVIDAGDTTCQADPATTRSALQALKNCEFSEYGAFYIDGSGDAVFISRTNLLKKKAQTPKLFNQSGGVPYSSIILAFDDKLIVNNASIQRIGGTAQTSSNAASIIKYFQHSLSQTNLVLNSDTDAANIALAYVSSRQETTQRFDSVTLDLAVPTSYQPATTAAALSLDFFYPVTITNTTPQGNIVTKTLEIFGVDWEITPTNFTCELTTSEPIMDGLLIGDSTYGTLDTTNNVLAY